MKKFVILCALCGLLVACAPQQQVVSGQAEVQNETFILRNLPWLKNVSTHERVLDSGLKEIMVKGRSSSGATRTCFVKVDWYTAGGFPIESRLSRWDPVTVQAEQPFIFTTVAPVEDAVNYHVLIIDKLRKGSHFSSTNNNTHSN